MGMLPQRQSEMKATLETVATHVLREFYPTILIAFYGFTVFASLYAGTDPIPAFITVFLANTRFVVSPDFWPLAILASCLAIALLRPASHIAVLMSAPLIFYGYFAWRYSEINNLPPSIIALMLCSFAAVPLAVFATRTAVGLQLEIYRLYKENTDLAKQVQKLSEPKATAPDAPSI